MKVRSGASEATVTVHDTLWSLPTSRSLSSHST